MSSRIPPLLDPYLALPPEASLILITSVLGASSNWLVLRFLYRALHSQDASSSLLSSPDLSPREDTKVLLVSFMRDLAFWKENARRLGLDLDKLALKKRFCFVDGLSGLFLPKQKVVSKGGERVLSSSSLSSVSGEIEEAIHGLQADGAKVTLVIDQLDLLLAAGGDQITAVGVGEMLTALQERVHSTVLTISADYPLVSAGQTPLDISHAAFLLNTAHQADLIIGLRLLDSGAARDVSGVLRIAVGDHDQAAEERPKIQPGVEDKELLYFVGGDGGVKVFERGQ